MKLTWQVCALGSAFFAAVTAILAKVGVRAVDSTLATAIRTVVILIFAWGIVAAQGNYRQLPQIDSRSWLFLTLSGLATGASWLFYFRALQMADASKVAPVDKFSLVITIILAAAFLHEKVSLRVFAGAALITVGTLLLLPKK